MQSRPFVPPLVLLRRRRRRRLAVALSAAALLHERPQDSLRPAEHAPEEALVQVAQDLNRPGAVFFVFAVRRGNVAALALGRPRSQRVALRSEGSGDGFVDAVINGRATAQVQCRPQQPEKRAAS
jgi:hypothetical protein